MKNKFNQIWSPLISCIDIFRNNYSFVKLSSWINIVNMEDCNNSTPQAHIDIYNC